MRTRSQSRRRRQQQVPHTFVESPNLEKLNNNQEPPDPPIVTMADNRTMAQMLQAPTEGYEDAIVVPAITADNFELKHSLLTLVQNKQFFRHDKEDPHARIRYFNKITSTMKSLNVPSMSVKLMLFPFSLEGATRIWLEKEPPRSILTWDDLVLKFIKQFFPPSKTTNLRNEITRFQQRFDESFYEAYDRFNDLFRACSDHGKLVVAKVSASTSTFGISPDVSELKDMVKALLLYKKNQSQTPAPIKAVEESCVTCGGAHSYQNCPATDGNVYHDIIQAYVSQAAVANFNQGNTAYQAPVYQASAPQTQGVSMTDFDSYVKENDAVMRNVQNQGQNLQAQLNNLATSNQRLESMLSNFIKMNTASTSGTGTLPSNTVTNPKEDLKGITTQSGVAYQGPTIPTSSSSTPKVVNHETEVTKDRVLPTNNGGTKDIHPPFVQISEPVVAPVSAPMPNQKISIPFPSRRNDERRREKANDQIEKFYEIFRDMSFKISFMDALTLMPKFASTLKTLIENKEKLSEMAKLNENFSAVILNKSLSSRTYPDLHDARASRPFNHRTDRYSQRRSFNGGKVPVLITVCINNCLLYWKNDKDLIACRTCGTSRWKVDNKTKKVYENIPAKVMWYFPIIPRLQRLFKIESISEDLRWHATQRITDGISANGVDVNTGNRHHSVWPVLTVIYNLPPWLCMKRKFINLSVLISGYPGNDIDVFLEPLVDDLHTLFETGVDTYDASTKDNFNLRVVVLWTINDYPALGTLCGCPYSGFKGCVVCGKDTNYVRLSASSKQSYVGHRRYLPYNHPFRKQKKAFNDRGTNIQRGKTY
ncbi:reverse transcriptase domain-containing protein [Tanacetum coccineum]